MHVHTIRLKVKSRDIHVRINKAEPDFRWTIMLALLVVICGS